MAVSLQDDELQNTEKVWLENGFFKDCQSDLTISKVNFPEMTFVYINQGQASLVKGGEQAIYLNILFAVRLCQLLIQIRQLIWIHISLKRIRSSFMCRCVIYPLDSVVV